MVRVTNKHRLGRALLRSGSGSFSGVDAVKRVKKCRVDSGLNASNYTQSYVDGYLWSLVFGGKLTVRRTAEGVFRYKPTPATANVLRAARVQFPGEASALKIGTYIWSKVGPIPKVTKRELFVLLYEKGLLATAAPAEAEVHENMDMDMEVDSGGIEEVPEMDAPNVARDEAGGSAGLPQTPHRPRPAQGYYPTPPNTVSPLRRYDSRVSASGSGLREDRPDESATGAMDPGSSANTSKGEGNLGLPVGINAGCIRPECQQRERDYQRTRADLEVAQAQAAEQREELQVLKLLQVDIEDRLAQAVSRNEHLADECDRYQKKHSGAEAALQRSQAMVHHMKEDMTKCLEQFRYC